MKTRNIGLAALVIAVVAISECRSNDATTAETKNPVAVTAPSGDSTAAQTNPAAGKETTGGAAASQSNPAPAKETPESPTAAPSNPVAEKETSVGKIAAEKNPVVVMETSEGSFTIELWADQAPLTVKNFLTYADEGFYDGTIFHRVIEGFMIQGGGFTPDMTQKPTKPPIKNEATAELKNVRGTISMARTGIVDSATSQFFINVKDNPSLDHRDDTQRGYGYAVFGRVIDGMDVVDKIRKVATHKVGMYGDVPVTPVVINSVKRVETK